LPSNRIKIDPRGLASLNEHRFKPRFFHVVKGDHSAADIACNPLMKYQCIHPDRFLEERNSLPTHSEAEIGHHPGNKNPEYSDDRFRIFKYFSNGAIHRLSNAAIQSKGFKLIIVV
jgi:hypothetical protein